MTHRIILVILAITVAFATGCTSQPTQPAEQQQPATPAAAETKPASPPTGPVAPPTTEADMIASALSAAPEAVAAEATVVTIDEKGQFKTLRQGTGQFTCIPDSPSPGVDPMCVDQNGVEWVKAWLAHKNPPAGKIGFAYMLMGGSDASNEDPFATAPPPGQAWVDTGPHVMILNSASRLDSYPKTHDNPKKPFVMFPGTPYEHLMIPVK